MSSPAIDVNGLSVDYGNRNVLQNLQLSIVAGQWTCLLGASGTGKTTLLRVIAGLEPRFQGRIQASDGEAISGRLAWMGQQDLLMPWMTVLENITLGSRLRRDPVHNERGMELLRRVGLEGEADTYPHDLSGGMRQRVALARTLYEDRPIVLMDEPFSSVDAITRHGLQDLALELLSQRTVVMVTHDPAEALKLGNQILILLGQPTDTVEKAPVTGDTPRDSGTVAFGDMEKRLWSILERGGSLREAA